MALRWYWLGPRDGFLSLSIGTLHGDPWWAVTCELTPGPLLGSLLDWLGPG